MHFFFLVTQKIGGSFYFTIEFLQSIFLVRLKDNGL